MNNKIITIFNEIRDIPFSIPTSPTDALFDCAGKAILLRKRLEEISIKTRFGVCYFYWDDLDLPDNVKSIAHDKDCTHTFVEAFINNKWIKLDPSWDNALSQKFEVAIFDGKNDTILAVKAIGFFNSEKSQNIMKNQEDNYNNVITDDLARNGKFYEALNKYLEEIRVIK